MFTIKSTFGPSNQRQTGYAIVNLDTDQIVAKFTTKSHGYWRFAKTAAERECERLNREAA
jgi:hypothetical protein